MSINLRRRQFLTGTAGAFAAASVSASLARFAPRIARAAPLAASAFANRYYHHAISTFGGPIHHKTLSKIGYQNPNFGTRMHSLSVDDKGRHTCEINAGPKALLHLVATDVAKNSTPREKWVAGIVHGAFETPPSHLSMAALELVNGSHSGRAGPRHLTAILALVNHYGTELGAHYGAKGGVDALEAWCDENFGLFCSAFVAQYARALGIARSPTESPQSFRVGAESATSHVGKPVTRRAHVKDIEPGDAFVFVTHNFDSSETKPEHFEHIGIIESTTVTDDEARVVTVESCMSDGHDGIVRSAHGLVRRASKSHRFEWWRMWKSEKEHRQVPNLVEIVPLVRAAGTPAGEV